MTAYSKLRSIGFDLPGQAPARNASWTASPVARVLAALQAEIDRRGVAARHLFTVTFNAREGNARVALREQPLAPDYPSLDRVFREISRACAQEWIGRPPTAIAVIFEEDEIKLVLINAAGKPEAYTFPVRAAGAY